MRVIYNAHRFVLGEGLEKRSSDLAAEVAEQKEAFEAAAASKAAAAAEAPAVEEAPKEARPVVEVRTCTPFFTAHDMART